MQGEGAGSLQPALVTRAGEQSQEREAVPGRAVAEPGIRKMRSAGISGSLSSGCCGHRRSGSNADSTSRQIAVIASRARGALHCVSASCSWRVGSYSADIGGRVYARRRCASGPITDIPQPVKRSPEGTPRHLQNSTERNPAGNGSEAPLGLRANGRRATGSRPSRRRGVRLCLAQLHHTIAPSNGAGVLLALWLYW